MEHLFPSLYTCMHILICRIAKFGAPKRFYIFYCMLFTESHFLRYQFYICNHMQANRYINTETYMSNFTQNKKSSSILGFQTLDILVWTSIVCSMNRDCGAQKIEYVVLQFRTFLTLILAFEIDLKCYWSCLFVFYDGVGP